MADFNFCAFSGRLGADPEMRYTSEGVAVTNFNLAVSTGKDSTMWLKCTAWRKLAENVNQYLNKGDEVIVLGALCEDSWEGDDGSIRKVLSFTVSSLKFGRQAASKTEEEPRQRQMREPARSETPRRRHAEPAPRRESPRGDVSPDEFPF